MINIEKVIERDGTFYLIDGETVRKLSDAEKTYYDAKKEAERLKSELADKEDRRKKEEIEAELRAKKGINEITRAGNPYQADEPSTTLGTVVNPRIRERLRKQYEKMHAE